MAKASVVVVCSGAPKRGMGWYHATQVLEGRCPSAALTDVVEPFYLSDAGSSAPGAEDFETWRTTLEKENGVRFHSAVEDVPPLAEGEKRMAVVAGRTGDNPSLFRSCLGAGCSVIYLEKPGAPSVPELKAMRDEAREKGARCYVGFNKNVSAYLRRTMDLAAEKPGSSVTFLHNNAYDEAGLPECFERNAEGMLKNMAIHELAILVTYYGVTVESIAEAVADSEYSDCRTLKGPSSGADFTDFVKLKFRIKTKDGKEASVAADRCGGDDSVGIVSLPSGDEAGRFVMPDNDAVAAIPDLEKHHPGAMPYFYAQDPDYAELKERVAKACAAGEEPEGAASIDGAIEALRVAEYLTPVLQKQLLEG
uniref:Gfo/Idh/MocA-like oxidoreductase N-terminal domain-containing protein n=1 Tax=Odontella aurita TaxID=265563 RepID=A0A6U6H1H6_9STRA